MMPGLSVEALVASGIGCVTAAGIYLMLRGRTFPVVVGLMLVGYAVNVFIFAMGRLWAAAPPILGAAPLAADPLPQALVLTAIVIGFATTGFVLELALRSRHETGTDHVDGDPAEADRDRMREHRTATRRNDRPGAGSAGSAGDGSDGGHSGHSGHSGLSGLSGLSGDSGDSGASGHGGFGSNSSESSNSSSSSESSESSESGEVDHGGVGGDGSDAGGRSNGSNGGNGGKGRAGPAAPAASTDGADGPGAAP